MDHLFDRSGTVVIVCALLIPLCCALVSLRLWARWTIGGLGIDDYFFFAGLVIWIASTAFIFPACSNGLGAHADKYTESQEILALKWFFFFQDLYVWANIPTKISLCLTLIRISNNQWITHTLSCLIAIIFGSSVATNIYLLTNCTPLQATWDTTMVNATCRSTEGTVVLANVYSAINIAVDWTIALLPVFLLWRVQLPWKQKLTVLSVLSLGIFASSATLIRLGTLTNFTNTADYLFGLAPIVLWTVLENALALIAGSLLTLRPLMRRWFGTRSDTETAGYSPQYSFKTFGQRSHVLAAPDENNSEIGMRTFISGGGASSSNDGVGGGFGVGGYGGENTDSESQRGMLPKDSLKGTRTWDVVEVV